MSINLKITSSLDKVERRDILMADRTLLKPSNANPLVMGEWIELDASSHGIRAAGTNLSWLVFAEKGRTDTQGTGKVPVLYLGPYEAETKVYDGTGIALGDPLMVASVTFESLARSGAKKWTAGHVVGYVLKVPAAGAYLKFIHLQ